MYSICSTCGKDDFDTKGKIFFTDSNAKASVCEVCNGIVLHMNNYDKDSLLSPSKEDMRNPCSMFNMTRNLKGFKDSCSNMYIRFQFLNLLKHYGQDFAIRVLYSLDRKSLIENGMYILASCVSLGSISNPDEQYIILNSPSVEQRPYLGHILKEIYLKIEQRDHLFHGVSNIQRLLIKEVVIYVYMYYKEGNNTLNTYPDNPFHNYLLRSFKEGIGTTDILRHIELILASGVAPDLSSLIDTIENEVIL